MWSTPKPATRSRGRKASEGRQIRQRDLRSSALPRRLLHLLCSMLRRLPRSVLGRIASRPSASCKSPGPNRSEARAGGEQGQHHQHPSSGAGDEQGADRGDRRRKMAITNASQRRRQTSTPRPSRPTRRAPDAALSRPAHASPRGARATRPARPWPRRSRRIRVALR